jgi:hypothetical protein
MDNYKIVLVEFRLPQGNNMYRRSVLIRISTVESVFWKRFKNNLVLYNVRSSSFGSVVFPTQGFDA